jgi:uncharacterized repeat protein (TIGR03803 family)
MKRAVVAVSVGAVLSCLIGCGGGGQANSPSTSTANLGYLFGERLGVNVYMQPGPPSYTFPSAGNAAGIQIDQVSQFPSVVNPEGADIYQSTTQVVFGQVTGPIAGKEVVVYSYTNEYYVQPLTSTTINISSGSTWIAPASAGQISALLVAEGYSAPDTTTSLPAVDGVNVFAVATAGASPSGATLPAATPAFSAPTGTYTSPQSVTISDTTPGATIYYTINGTTPTSSSTLYTDAITVDSTETIEAIAIASGYSTSAVATGTYTIGSSPSFSTLVNFNGSNGDEPVAALVQGVDGNFYGTTYQGGASGYGTVFKITPVGTLTTLYNFCSQTNCTDGSGPEGMLVLATDGNFYGTTYQGGASGYGTVFKITPAGTLTTLYSFCSQAMCTDGIGPEAGLIQGTDGNFYGTTAYGGGANGDGTAFKITPAGTLTTLYSFCSQTDCTDGHLPTAGLIQGTDGNFYGTSTYGGANNDGTVFRITPAGTLTTLYSFCSQTNCTDGSLPTASLIQGTDGDFYGTTSEGGANTDGTVFRITPAGTLTTLYSFCSQTNCTDGIEPNAGLIQGTDGNFYGTTYFGGTYSEPTDGTVFEITPAGTLTTLYSFCSQTNCSDGDRPFAGLIQGTSGTFYGTAAFGGADGDGTVFSLWASAPSWKPCPPPARREPLLSFWETISRAPPASRSTARRPSLSPLTPPEPQSRPPCRPARRRATSR